MAPANKPVLALLLAAGKGTRMKSRVPKVLHALAGKPILGHLLEVLTRAGITKKAVVVGHGEKEVRSFINKTDSKVETVRQVPQLGTGHAVLCAGKMFRNWKGNLLVMPGDAPCVKPNTLRRMMDAHERAGAAATILTSEVKNPFGYGRVLRNGEEVLGIREHLDANEGEREISEINSGIYLFDTGKLLQYLAKVKADNKKREYYLTDVIHAFASDGLNVRAVLAETEDEALGINSRADLAKLEKVMNSREIEKHQKNGVTVVSPENTFIAFGVTIGADTTIYPFSWIGENVKIGRDCQIGPFAVIRENSVIEEGAIIGSFVEVVRSKVGRKSRVKHLTYLGDAILGEEVNIGAGTVTANYDGVRKSKTVIGKKAFIGSNTVLVAPVTIGAKAKTGAGSVVLSKSNVPSGKTVVGVPARLMGKKK